MNKMSFIDKIYSKKSINKIKEKIDLLGDDYKYTVRMVLNYRLLMTILIFVSFIVFVKNGYLYAPIIAFFTYFGMTYLMLDFPIKQRSIKLEHEAIFFFEILELTLESGRTLSQALDITSKNVDGELSNEFKKTLEEVKLGKSLIEGLKSMRKRIPSDTINNTILNITESSIFGSNIIESLNNQLEYLRNKRMMEIKGRIAKLPTQISVISVIFFVPLLLLIILSPVILEFLLG